MPNRKWYDRVRVAAECWRSRNSAASWLDARLDRLGIRAERIWIDLSEPTYGLHGGPEPELVDKTQWHGCVRITNWDARGLAEMVEQGTVVEFVGR